jgi:hypothetical protein
MRGQTCTIALTRGELEQGAWDKSLRVRIEQLFILDFIVVFWNGNTREISRVDGVKSKHFKR